jgi:ParB family transcriptional regulator, chromosome partitioning protein
MSTEARRTERGLGRGLAALIPGPQPEMAAQSPLEIEIGAIRPNPHQPRRSFPADELDGLAQSISQHGVLQPVLVVQADDGYILIAGERRLRAVQRLGHRSIPAIVRTANDQSRLEMALVENIQRSDLNAMDEARAFRQLIDEFGLTQLEVAQRVGRSRPAISNSLRLLELAPEVQQAVADGTISGGHARALAGLESHAAQVVVLSTVVSRELSVRQTEALVATWRAESERVSREPGTEPDPDMQQMEARMREALGTKVTIATGRRGGRITITWYDHDDLGRLVERLSAVDAWGEGSR